MPYWGVFGVRKLEMKIEEFQKYLDIEYPDLRLNATVSHCDNNTYCVHGRIGYSFFCHQKSGIGSISLRLRKSLEDVKTLVEYSIKDLEKNERI
jgi:hypothetical protein